MRVRRDLGAPHERWPRQIRDNTAEEARCREGGERHQEVSVYLRTRQWSFGTTTRENTFNAEARYLDPPAVGRQDVGAAFFFLMGREKINHQPPQCAVIHVLH